MLKLYKTYGCAAEKLFPFRGVLGCSAGAVINRVIGCYGHNSIGDSKLTLGNVSPLDTHRCLIVAETNHLQ